jgi:alkanesulfonate monooxygenase SsuD/methylene tetrahydromethanopterin reductase-like flavin-dependent oxidoreductase (luciferase family)
LSICSRIAVNGTSWSGPYDGPAMKSDLILSPWGANASEMVDAARVADARGYDTVWTYDHFSGLVAGKGWSRDPFVTLGAIAAVTERVGLGLLVANVVNRHPAQLACAVNSLQSLAPGRVRCGVGAGSTRGGRFASEHDAIGRPLAGAQERQALLAETIQALRALWRGDAFDGAHVYVAASMAVTDGADAPQIIVGASSSATIEVACEHADGVNLLPGPEFAARVAFALDRRPSETFEVSAFLALDAVHPLGGDPSLLEDLGVDRRTLHVSAPYPVDAIARIGERL